MIGTHASKGDDEDISCEPNKYTETGDYLVSGFSDDMRGRQMKMANYDTVLQEVMNKVCSVQHKE